MILPDRPKGIEESWYNLRIHYAYIGNSRTVLQTTSLKFLMDTETLPIGGTWRAIIYICANATRFLFFHWLLHEFWIELSGLHPSPPLTRRLIAELLKWTSTRLRCNRFELFWWKPKMYFSCRCRCSNLFADSLLWELWERPLVSFLTQLSEIFRGVKPPAFSLRPWNAHLEKVWGFERQLEKCKKSILLYSRLKNRNWFKEPWSDCMASCNVTLSPLSVAAFEGLPDWWRWKCYAVNNAI